LRAGGSHRPHATTKQPFSAPLIGVCKCDETDYGQFAIRSIIPKHSIVTARKYG